MPERAWTLAAAREMLGEIARRTETARRETKGLETRPGHASEAALAANRARTEAVISRWLREMEALGVEARGPWHVDFEAEGGAYCWQWPEKTLSYFHAKGAAADERIRIQ